MLLHSLNHFIYTPCFTMLSMYYLLLGLYASSVTCFTFVFTVQPKIYAFFKSIPKEYTNTVYVKLEVKELLRQYTFFGCE